MDPRFETKKPSAAAVWRRRLLILGLATLLTALYFLALPLLEQLGEKVKEDLVVRQAPTIDTPPPDAPIEEDEPEPEEEDVPEMADQAQALELSQLQMALNPGGSGPGGGVTIDVSAITGSDGPGGGSDFALGDLDKEPRAVYRPNPRYPRDMQRQGIQGTVWIAFIVAENGRVEKAKVKESSHPGFEKAALDAVRRWTFEPGSRKGKPVSFRMVVPITFSLG